MFTRSGYGLLNITMPLLPNGKADICERVHPGKNFHPVLIVIDTLAEHFFAHDWNSDDPAKEMKHLLLNDLGCLSLKY
jgi:hypothetical protein